MWPIQKTLKGRLRFLVSFGIFSHSLRGHLRRLVGRVLDHRSLPPEFESLRGHIWRVFHVWLRFITFRGRSAHLVYHVHKSVCKTSIIIIMFSFSKVANMYRLVKQAGYYFSSCATTSPPQKFAKSVPSFRFRAHSFSRAWICIVINCLILDVGSFRTWSIHTLDIQACFFTICCDSSFLCHFPLRVVQQNTVALVVFRLSRSQCLFFAITIV